mmetsp:Transcript_41747/g.105254  ORF Transcript_41747/g.105254 Transcript_41747/m.105254 type:complete len:218 (-) Transcript_41747:1043-1696(-)
MSSCASQTTTAPDLSTLISHVSITIFHRRTPSGMVNANVILTVIALQCMRAGSLASAGVTVTQRSIEEHVLLPIHVPCLVFDLAHLFHLHLTLVVDLAHLFHVPLMLVIDHVRLVHVRLMLATEYDRRDLAIMPLYLTAAPRMTTCVFLRACPFLAIANLCPIGDGLQQRRCRPRRTRSASYARARDTTLPRAPRQSSQCARHRLVRSATAAVGWVM